MQPSIQSIALLIIVLSTLPSINGDDLQEPNTVPQLPDSLIKCGSCPCVDPCDSQPQLPPPSPSPSPPPPESSPSPAPPPAPLPSPPPPPPPVVQYCPPVVVVKPPPPPRFIIVTNPPTNVYRPFTLQMYSGGGFRVYGGFNSWIVVVGYVVLEWVLF